MAHWVKVHAYKWGKKGRGETRDHLEAPGLVSLIDTGQNSKELLTQGGWRAPKADL